MHIESYVARYCVNNGKPNQKSGCGIVLLAHDYYDHEMRMNIGQPMGSTNQALAEIKAIWFALLAIKRDFRYEPVIVYTNCYFADKMLTKNNEGYVANPKKNRDEIMRLRNVYESFSSIHIEYQKDLEDNEFGNMAKSLATTVTTDQKRKPGQLIVERKS